MIIRTLLPDHLVYDDHFKKKREKRKEKREGPKKKRKKGRYGVLGTPDLLV